MERRGLLEGWLGTRRRPQRDLAVAATNGGLGVCAARTPGVALLARTSATLALLGAAACVAAPLAPDSVARHTFRGATMGTTYAVTVVGRGIDDRRLDSLQADVQGALDRVDATMSHYRSDSDLSRFNRWRGTAPLEVAGELVGVVRESIAISGLTDGALDVTVAPLVDAWGFGAPGPAAALPTETEIAALRRDVGYRYLEADEASSTLRKERPGVRIDLSSIAKGHGVDRAAEALAAGGIADYLVEVGGRGAGGRSDRDRGAVAGGHRDAPSRTVGHPPRGPSGRRGAGDVGRVPQLLRSRRRPRVAHHRPPHGPARHPPAAVRERPRRRAVRARTAWPPRSRCSVPTTGTPSRRSGAGRRCSSSRRTACCATG